ncbi:bile acid:sodium symporter family protein [Parapedobacter lycopersici]|uniref:bile acid:sodium symporter family protein n=1 Tax=Parapedobacter lycopersici TaxID=1864939 RepID=UPI00214D2CD6|nr:bile acid:sodium symporter family protein [Parapedobacter lycopersici]
MSKRHYKTLLGLAITCLVIAITMAAAGYMHSAGPFLIAFFLGLSFAVKGFPPVKGLSFTILILAVVTTAMYYPHLFVEIGGFELAILITPLVQVIMFGMGSSMGLKDFIELAKRPRAVFIGVLAQFTIMPALAYALALISNFPPEISAGLILLGCAPTSVTASLFSYLAKANVALAITVTSLTTLLAPLLLPLLMKLFAGNFVEIAVLAMMWDMAQIVLIPIGVGLLFNHFLSGRAKWLDAAMPKVSMAGVALIVAIIIAAGRESLLNIGFLLLFMVLAHNVLGYFFGYWMARLFKMDERDCRTIAIATGMQNAGLVSGIAKTMGKIATIGLASAVCGPIMGFTASIIASHWSNAGSKASVRHNENKEL